MSNRFDNTQAYNSFSNGELARIFVSYLSPYYKAKEIWERNGKRILKTFDLPSFLQDKILGKEVPVYLDMEDYSRLTGDEFTHSAHLE